MLSFSLEPPPSPLYRQSQLGRGDMVAVRDTIHHLAPGQIGVPFPTGMVDETVFTVGARIPSTVHCHSPPSVLLR